MANAPKTVRAIIIESGGYGYPSIIHDSLPTLQGLVGGYIQGLPCGDDAHAYINDEGKFDPLTCKPNMGATRFAHEFIGIAPDDWIAGTMVILGNGANGEEADAPAWVDEWANNYRKRGE
jgi:hypothetical protein